MSLVHVRRFPWWILTIHALAVATYAIVVLALPVARQPFVRERLLAMPLALYVHLLGGSIALAIGPFQFLASLRTKHLTWHRWMGRTYLVSVLGSGLGGFRLAFSSQAGLAAHSGFAALAIVWLFTGVRGYQRIRAGDQIDHRRWMVRNYSLTFAAVTLRTLLGPTIAFGVPFDTAYSAIAWLSWVPNLIVAEWWFVRRVAPSAPARSARSAFS